MIYIMHDLHEACRNGDIETVNMLIKKGVNINDKNVHNSPKLTFCETPLIIACFYDKYDIAKLLISHGANVNEKNDYGTTALHVACLYGNYNTAKLLLEHDANVNVKNNCDETPLHVACGCYVHNNHGNGNYVYRDIVKILLEYGANINNENNIGETPLKKINKVDTNIAKYLRKDIDKRIYILSLIIQYDVLKHYIVRKID